MSNLHGQRIRILQGKFNPYVAKPPKAYKDIVTWVQKYRNLKDPNKPFSFENREYLKPIYRDNNPEIYIVKGRQTEISEYALNWMLYNLITHPFTVGLYVSDRDSHTSKFSNLRLKKWALDCSPALHYWAPPKNHNATTMPFTNGSWLFMHSAWDDFDQARSVPADFTVVDEIQNVEVGSIAALKESMAHSKYKRLLGIGTGLEEGSDWHKLWSSGDQKEWDTQSKTWIPEQPDNIKTASSYHLSQEIVPWITAEDIEAKRNNPSYSPRMFETEVLGWWFRGASKPLTAKDIYALFDKTRHILSPDEVDPSRGSIIMGIDWGGGTKAFTIPIIAQVTDMNTPHFDVIYFDKVTEPDTEKQADRMINLINDYNVNQVVMDAGGGTRQVQKLENTFASRTIKATYMTRPEEPINMEHLYTENHFVIDRTYNIETVIDIIKRPQQIPDYPHPIPRITFPAFDLSKIEWIIDQYTCIEAESVNLSSGKKYTRYTHPEGQPDDFMQATCYLYDAYLMLKTGLDIGGRKLKGSW